MRAKLLWYTGEPVISPGFSVHGILQARILEWVALSSSRGSSQSRDQTCRFLALLHWQLGFLPLAAPGKPRKGHYYITTQASFLYSPKCACSLWH